MGRVHMYVQWAGFTHGLGSHVRPVGWVHTWAGFTCGLGSHSFETSLKRLDEATSLIEAGVASGCAAPARVECRVFRSRLHQESDGRTQVESSAT